jgi:hypothetical protein
MEMRRSTIVIAMLIQDVRGMLLCMDITSGIADSMSLTIYDDGHVRLYAMDDNRIKLFECRIACTVRAMTVRHFVCKFQIRKMRSMLYGLDIDSAAVVVFHFFLQGDTPYCFTAETAADNVMTSSHIVSAVDDPGEIPQIPDLHYTIDVPHMVVRRLLNVHEMRRGLRIAFVCRDSNLVEIYLLHRRIDGKELLHHIDDLERTADIKLQATASGNARTIGIVVNYKVLASALEFVKSTDVVHFVFSKNYPMVIITMRPGVAPTRWYIAPMYLE